MTDRRHRCENCGFPVQRVIDQEAANADLNIRNSYLQGEITKLRTQQAKDPEADPFFADARAVYEYWKAKVMPGARAFNGSRATKVLARLKEGHTVDGLKQAVDGAERSTWWRKKGITPDLKKICEDDAHVLQFQADATPSENSHKPVPAREQLKMTGKEQRLRDRVERLENEKRHLEDRVSEVNQTAANWRASFHEALDYLDTYHKPLARVVEDSNEQRFRALVA